MPSASFRAGVVAVVLNSRDELLAFERSDVQGAWQLPQGGIDVGETPTEAAWRELGEETGLGRDDVVMTGQHPKWLAYEFPDHVRSEGKRLGQVQRWFFFRVRSDDVVVQPDGVEFVASKWVEASWLVEQVVAFRSEVYQDVLLP